MSLKINLSNLPASFKRYLLTAIIFALANFTYMFFILRVRNVFIEFMPSRLATAAPILLYIWFNLIYAAFSTHSGILSDKIGRKHTLAIGYAVYGLTCLGFIWAASIGSFLLLFALYGLSFALIEGNQRAFVSDFVKDDLRGTALGAFHTAISISALPASLIAGILWNWNPQAPFLYGAIIRFLAVLNVSRLQPEKLIHRED